MKFEDMINNIINCDCYEMIKNIPDKSIDLIIIDPPYEFDSGGGGGHFGTKERNYHNEYLSLYHETGSTKETERLRISANKQKQKEQYRFISKGFDFKLFDEFIRILKKINIYIWCSKSQVGKIITYFENINCNIDILTWHKTNPTPTINNTYANDTEYCIFIRESGVKLYGNYDTKRKYYITSANIEDKKKYNHPTIKPLNIIKNFIINSSNENDIVLDCFCGSGTTCVACKETGRRFIGMKINKEYYEIAKKRINGMTASGQMSMMFNDKGEVLNE